MSKCLNELVIWNSRFRDADLFPPVSDTNHFRPPISSVFVTLVASAVSQSVCMCCISCYSYIQLYISYQYNNGLAGILYMHIYSLHTAVLLYMHSMSRSSIVALQHTFDFDLTKTTNTWRHINLNPASPSDTLPLHSRRTWFCRPWYELLSKRHLILYTRPLPWP